MQETVLFSNKAIRFNSFQTSRYFATVSNLSDFRRWSCK